MHYFGELPAQGDCIEVGGIRFCAQRIEVNRIAEVTVELLTSATVGQTCSGAQVRQEAVNLSDPGYAAPPESRQ